MILFFAFDGNAEPVTQPANNQVENGYLHEIRIGLLAHDVDNLWSGFKREEGVDFNTEIIFKRLWIDLLNGIIRPNLGVNINNQGDTSKIYGGVLWEKSFKPIFFNIGIGIALHNGELETKNINKKSLGSRVLFRIPIEIGLTIYGLHGLSLLFEHISNGYLASPNEGLDTLGLRYSVHF